MNILPLFDNGSADGQSARTDIVIVRNWVQQTMARLDAAVRDDRAP